MSKDKLTTIAGIVAAICAAVLGTGVFETGSPLFIGVTTVGAIAVGLLGYFAKDKKDG